MPEKRLSAVHRNSLKLTIKSEIAKTSKVIRDADIKIE